MWNQVKLWSSQLRTQFYNCVEKPEKFRSSTGFEPVTSRFRCDALTNWAMKPLTLAHIRSSYDSFHIPFHHWFIPHGTIRTHKWPAPNVSGFIAQLVRASHRNREVTGSNPVEVLNFQAYLRNCKNCVRNCEDHSFTWFCDLVSCFNLCEALTLLIGW